MCGRYVPNTEDEIMEIKEILNEISIRLAPIDLASLVIDHDIYPSALAPIIYLNGEISQFGLSRFGIKKWGPTSELIINARSEKINNNYFSNFLNEGRCIVPAHGYYEWKKVSGKSSEKYYFTNSIAKDCLFMLGLYKKEENAFVIITKEADDELKDIHHRMPVIIKKEYIFNWLLGSLDINNLNSGFVDIKINSFNY